MLGGPLFFVAGNHANEVKNLGEPEELWQYPGGCENIDGLTVRYHKLLVAGLSGSMRYNNNLYFQYTEQEMAWKVWRLVPSLVLNKLRYGRYLDILITHAPPLGIHDQPDLCHRGFRAFRMLMDLFPPRYLIHGHVHVYSPQEPTETRYRNTTVINTYGYRTLEIAEGMLR
jgi:Icc-related predicted phosphoesterase